MYLELESWSSSSAVDRSSHGIHRGENLFCCWLYLHTVTVDRSSLDNGFISHRRAMMYPKDMFVCNAMNNRRGDEEWVMKIYSEASLASGWWGMCAASLAVLYRSFAGEFRQERSADCHQRTLLSHKPRVSQFCTFSKVQAQKRHFISVTTSQNNRLQRNSSTPHSSQVPLL